jgi:hypothetical protein
MSDAVLNVKAVPNLLVSKFHSNTISWREENGALIFQSVISDISNCDRKRAAFERLKRSRSVSLKDFDYKKELLSGIDEKYGSID